MTDLDFSKLSITITNELEKKEKKENGIFITPPSFINEIIKLLQPYISNIKYVLEPSCGTCEFIPFIIKTIKDPIIDCV